MTESIADIFKFFSFHRSHFSMDGLPKTVLWNWTQNQKLDQPAYKTVNIFF